MALLVADTSALVSLGTVVDRETSPLDVLLDAHEVVVPDEVVDELNETAVYDDPSGTAAQAVLDRRSAFVVRSTELDETFPLDAGENAAVTLTNDLDASQLLCDEFNQLALVHASVADARLVTTPSVLVTMVRNDLISADTARELLDGMRDARSWEANAYVARAEAMLERE